MKGIELSEKYYKTYGERAFSEAFPDVLPFLCFGIAGAGSDSYGFDDEISQDHDFEPGFCVFYPEDKLSSKQVFALERAYAKLPAEFMGFSRPKIAAYGGLTRRGVIGVNEFFSRYVPGGSVPADVSGWASVPVESLCEAVNGRVFADNYGLFSSIRTALSDMPGDVRKKRVSGLIFALSQSGWYNALRMLNRGDFAASRLYMAEFARDAARCVYLLNDRYSPYLKWLVRGLKELGPDTGGQAAASEIETLLNLDITGAYGAAELIAVMSKLSELILQLCTRKYETALRELPQAESESVPDRWIRLLESAAFSINDVISDNYLRNSDVLMLV